VLFRSMLTTLNTQYSSTPFTYTSLSSNLTTTSTATTLSTLIYRNPTRNIPVEINVQKQLFQKLSKLYQHLKSRAKYFQDITDIPERFADLGQVEDVDLANLELDQKVSFLLLHIGQLGDCLFERINVIEQDVEKITLLQSALSLQSQTLESLSQAKEKLESRLPFDSNSLHQTDITSRTSLVNSLSNNLESLKQALAPTKNENSILTITHQALNQEIESLKPALHQLNQFIAELDSIREKTDPRVSYLGCWINSGMDILQSITGVLSITDASSNSFIVEYPNNLKLIVTNPDSEDILIESTFQDCTFTDIIKISASLPHPSRLQFILSESHTRLQKFSDRKLELESISSLIYDSKTSEVGWTIPSSTDGKEEISVLVKLGWDYPEEGGIEFLDVRGSGGGASNGWVERCQEGIDGRGWKIGELVGGDFVRGMK